MAKTWTDDPLNLYQVSQHIEGDTGQYFIVLREEPLQRLVETFINEQLTPAIEEYFNGTSHR